MRRSIPLLLALLATSAQADELEIVIGKTIQRHTGVVVQLRQHEAIGRLDFGSTGYTTQPANTFIPLGVANWTVVVDGDSLTNCRLIDLEHKAQGGMAFVYRCAP